VRLAHVRVSLGLRLVAARAGEWVDVATLSGDERLATLSGLLAAGPEAWADLRSRLGDPGAATEPPTPAGPVHDHPERIFCVGRNYVEHRNEFGNAPTPWPEVFLRLGSSLTGPYDDVPRPSVAEKVDYEGELAVIIGRPGRHIAAGEAIGHIFGYTVANDVSVRDWQHRGRQWTGGKNFDGTLPLGPVIVTADELDATDLALRTRVNGTVVQSARTSQFIFSLGEQIEFISSFTALGPGDVLITGTPGGVGAARNPPVLLRDGDLVEVEIEGIGTIRNRIVDDGLTPATDRWRAVANDGNRA
jgi:acylpyruvate hydrolase